MIRDDNRFLNYRGLEHLIGKIKTMFPRMLTYKGTVATYEALQLIENPEIGDVYHVEDTGAEYYWNGEHWEYAGEVVQVNYISEEAPGTKSVAVGGIQANTDVSAISGKPVSEVFDMILFPDAEPTINGSESVSIDGDIIKFGETCPTKIGSHSDRSVTYSKLNNEGSVLSNQTYSGVFTGQDVLYDGSSTKPNKVLANITVSYSGSWATGDKYPCTKKGAVPADQSKRNPAPAVATKTATNTIECWFPYFYGNNKSAITSGTEVFVTSKPSTLQLSFDSQGELVQHFIALPQGWSVSKIEVGATDVTNTFTSINTTINYTNNGETAQNVPMKLVYLTNPSASTITYKFTLS